MNSRPRRHRPALIVLVVAAAAGCLALGWWQWMRFEAAGGTGQNLGYALQWPLFAAFVLYAYRRFVQLEDEQGDSGTTEADTNEAGTTEPSQTNRPAEPREIPPDLLPPRPAGRATDGLDERATEYNRYLAELNARDRTDRSTT